MFTWVDDVTVTGRGDLLQLGDIVTSYIVGTMLVWAQELLRNVEWRYV